MYLIVFKLYLVGLETVKRALSDWSIKCGNLSNCLIVQVMIFIIERPGNLLFAYFPAFIYGFFSSDAYG